MKVLFVVGDLDSPTGKCVKIVAHNLAEKGEKVFILAERCRIMDIDFCHVDIVSNRNFLKNGIQSPIWNYFVINCRRLRALLYSPIWPFSSIKKPRLLLKCSETVVVYNQIDTVVAVNYGFNSIYVGHKLKEKYALTFIAYFLDGCYAGPCPRFFPVWLKDKMALKWENKLLSNSDGVVMMKSAEPKYIRNKKNIIFYNKITFLDIPLYQPQIKENVVRTLFPTNQIIILYTGGMLRNIRPPHYFLNLFASLKSDIVHLYLAGKTDYQAIVDKICNDNKNVHYLGVVDNNKVQLMMKEADFLLNIGNNLLGMVPSKIFEYMSYGKPIISTYRMDDDTSLPYLKKYSASLLIDERKTISENQNLLRSFIFEKRSTISSENQFFNNTPECFSEYILGFKSY